MQIDDAKLYRALGMAVALAGARREGVPLPADALAWENLIRSFAEMTNEQMAEIKDYPLASEGTVNPIGNMVSRAL